MSKMLEALKRIEARQPEPAIAPEEDAAEGVEDHAPAEADVDPSTKTVVVARAAGLPRPERPADGRATVVMKPAKGEKLGGSQPPPAEDTDTAQSAAPAPTDDAAQTHDAAEPPPGQLAKAEPGPAVEQTEEPACEPGDDVLDEICHSIADESSADAWLEQPPADRPKEAVESRPEGAGEQEPEPPRDVAAIERDLAAVERDLALVEGDAAPVASDVAEAEPEAAVPEGPLVVTAGPAASAEPTETAASPGPPAPDTESHEAEETGEAEAAPADVPVGPPAAQLSTLGDSAPPVAMPLEETRQPAEGASQAEPDGRAQAAPAPATPPAYQSLAEAILGRLARDRSSAVLLTSPGDGQGNTAVAAALAGALAACAGGEVLLVDANMRSPGLAGRLGVEVDRGFRDAVTGGAQWQGLVHKTNVAGVSLLPGVSAPKGASGKMPERLDLRPLLDQMRGAYRLVVVDGPSLVHPEAAALVRHCEATCLVVRVGQAARRAVAESAEIIQLAGGWLLGCVAVEP